jgi:Fic family protein
MIIDTNLIGINKEKIIYETDTISELLSQTQELLKKAGKCKISKDTLIIDAYHSATIEGARTTIANVKNKFENPQDKSDIMVVNNVKALDMVYGGFKIDDNSIRTIWETLVKNVCENKDKKGEKYRSGQVMVASMTEIIHIPPEADKLQKYMDSLFSYIESNNEDTLIKAIIAHFYFVYVHPYCDGNGRLARLLVNYILFNSNYPEVKKISISESINNNLGAYYNTIKESEKATKINGHTALNMTPHIKYMLEMISQACQKVQTKQFTLNDNEKKLITKMNKKGIGTEITVETATKILKTDDIKARYVLNTLTEKGILIKRKSGAKNIYILAVK